MPSRQDGWKWMRHVMLAWVLVVTLIAGSSRASGDIVVMQHDGPAYGVTEGSNSWLLARQRRRLAVW